MERPRDFPKIGEQHPEGSRMSPRTKIQKDTLNFGWFSLPSTKKDHDSAEHRLNSPIAEGGLQNGCTSPENDQRPTSKEIFRPDSQPRSPTAMESAKRCEAEQPRYEQQEPGYSQTSQNPPPMSPAYKEISALDWPLSPLAGERVVRQHITTEPNVQPTTPMTRSESQVSPIPIPPLQWQGYQNYPRPTYASWQSQVQDNRDHQAQNTYNHGWNVNNSSASKDTGVNKSDSSKNREKNMNKIREKNSNNNNDIEKSGRRSNYSSNKSLISVSNYSADGNNNNWLLGDTEGGSSPTKYVRTLPPYEYSMEASPTFYNPNVIMKWEDTEQQSNSKQDKQSFKPASLMKRIRSSFLQMWSLVPCMKNQADENTTPRSRLFKYDRFDNEKTPKQKRQEAHCHD